MRNAEERLRTQSRQIQEIGPPSLLLGIGDGGPDGVLGGNAGLGESVVSRIEVFAILADGATCQDLNRLDSRLYAYLLHLVQDILVGGQLAVQAEELLLLCRQFLQQTILAPGNGSRRTGVARKGHSR